MTYEGSHILQFEAAADDDLRKAMRTCQEKADNNIELAGEKVAVFTEKLESDVWSFFLCRPLPGVLICATDKSYLEETLKRIGRKPTRRALPAELAEWQHVDVKARIWAIRHYLEETAENDPSSPLRPKAAANFPDTSAVGFVFWYSPGADKIARARYLSSAKGALKIATEGWHHPTQGLVPNINQSSAGVVEIAASVSEERTADMFLFVLLAYLGHAIYL